MPICSYNYTPLLPVNMPICSYNYAPLLPVNVSRLYFSMRLQGACKNLGVWGRDYNDRGMVYITRHVKMAAYFLLLYMLFFLVVYQTVPWSVQLENIVGLPHITRICLSPELQPYTGTVHMETNQETVVRWTIHTVESGY